ncbi:MAG: glycosyltransferase [Phycisphaerae bacterium]|nr:glycosyltransferase [Phycisphaerae bacterium]
MRVMLLVTDLEHGGTPLRIARLARGLHAAGVEVFAGCLAPPGPVSAELAAAGIPTFACLARVTGVRERILAPAMTLQRLYRHVRRIRPDLIHSTLTHANVAARLMGLMQRVPVVSSTATIEVERRWHRMLERASARLDQGHIVNSAALAEHVVRTFGVPRRRVHIVPPSLDAPPRGARKDSRTSQGDRSAARKALGIPEHEFVVAWVGRLDPVKRLDLLVKCAEIMGCEKGFSHQPWKGFLHQPYVPSRFLLVGDGPERTRLEQILRLSPAGPAVHLLGWRDDVGPILSAADAFLFPSLTEGMPNAVLEAMACGLPIVASDIPALRELAGARKDSRTSGERLRLVGGDEPRCFAEALLTLRTDENARRALGERAAAWARENLDPRATVQAVLQVYRQVLGGKRT